MFNGSPAILITESQCGVLKMASKDKWVRRFSVDETAKHKNGFTIYKITSVLFPISSPEAVTSISVWKRYSDVQRLHKSMRSLHSGLHLRGTFPPLPKYSFFKRFQREVIEERSRTIKTLLEFIAEHRLLFTSTDFVNFLQTGYPEPSSKSVGVINAIRSSLHLPLEETPPLEYQTDDDDGSPAHVPTDQRQSIDRDETDYISQIPIYEAADVEIRQSPVKPKISDSFESLNSLESIDSDLYDELSKMTVTKPPPRVLPDLISFDAPSTSRFEDYHTMKKEPDAQSVTSHSYVSEAVSPSPSDGGREGGYVVSAHQWLQTAAKCHQQREYRRAFHCYKAAIELMLQGVQTDPDPQRRSLIKEKTNKYLSYAESIYKNHLCDEEREQNVTLVPDPSRPVGSVPVQLLRRPYEDLALYRVLGVLGPSVMLVLHRELNACYAMKVVRKIPNNLTEFDEYFLQRTNETREPILPTDIPYMVTLHSYIETNNLLFLILSYAPGEKLFDYIKRYVRSTPNTPKYAERPKTPTKYAERPNTPEYANRPNTPSKHTERLNPTEYVNRPNTPSKYTERSNTTEYAERPNTPVKYADAQNENLPDTLKNSDISSNTVKESVNNNKSDLDEVTEMVLNSQKLLKNVDKALSGPCDDPECFGDNDDVDQNENDDAACGQIPVQPAGVLPPSAVCKWAAEILTALESLHNCGVICGDLSPSHVVLGSGGQALLTYIVRFPTAHAWGSVGVGKCTVHVAPEAASVGEALTPAADVWSYGVLLYALLCGKPLCHYHRCSFTSHTILHIPEGLSLEEESILTQLLTYEPSERLTIPDIKQHPYFKQIDWTNVYEAWTPPD